jgi:hypothetical protein
MTARWYALVDATFVAAASAGGAPAGGGLSASYAPRSSGELGSMPGTAAASAE